jgi:hypothetical protein
MSELPSQRDFEDFGAWSGRDVLGPDGDRLGAVDVIFLDEATDVPEWVLVSLDDDDSAFVPLAGASVEERAIRVDQDRERVAGAPRPEPAETLSVADERRLYEHYGLAYSQSESSTVLPEGATAEEERPRLRKYVGAPVPAPAPASEETATEETASMTEQPAASAGDMAPRAISEVPASPIPGPAPHVVPPDGGFQAHDESKSSRVPSALRKPKAVIPAVLAGALAGLIAVLAFRRRR